MLKNYSHSHEKYNNYLQFKEYLAQNDSVFFYFLNTLTKILGVGKFDTKQVATPIY